LHGIKVLPTFVANFSSRGVKHTPETLKNIDVMNVENVKSQMRKGILEYCILLLLDREALYTTDIIQKLQAAQLIVVEGTLYPLLTRLKNSGLLTYQWVESTQGPPRKYYRLTDQGATFLAELELAWKELNDTISHIKNNLIA
jgi:PadR family transcriptional regulator PadR